MLPKRKQASVSGVSRIEIVKINMGKYSRLDMIKLTVYDDANRNRGCVVLFDSASLICMFCCVWIRICDTAQHSTHKHHYVTTTTTRKNNYNQIYILCATLLLQQQYDNNKHKRTIPWCNNAIV